MDIETYKCNCGNICKKQISLAVNMATYHDKLPKRGGKKGFLSAVPIRCSSGRYFDVRFTAYSRVTG